ncbi:hypothetical protein TFLX_02852 [Thermoflexales bacterium]|nr:hypothetical protein TFLX_02852 [Thermoflexales bacterium]
MMSLTNHLNALFARRWFGVILFVAFLLLWAVLTKVHTHSWQEESRMATVQALVEQGTFIIDHTELNRTGDKVFINGHFYSDKTPLLSVAAAGGYLLLHNVFGLTLDPAICVPDEDAAACRAFTPTGTRFTAFYWLTLIFIGGSASLLIVLFWHALLNAGVSGTAATALAITLGLASPLAPYSIVFAGHVPAALCFFAGFYLLIASLGVEALAGRSTEHAGGPTKTSTPFVKRCHWKFFWAGFFISLAANIDLTVAIFLITFGLWVLFVRWRQLLPFALGAVVPFALSALVNYSAAGTIMPLYFDPKAYDFVGTVLNTTVGGTNGFYSWEFGLRYTYDMFIGQRGLFSFTPMLIFAFSGMAAIFKQHRQRGLIAAALGGSLIFAVYLILRTDNFGGLAWGTRWFVPLVPVWWYFAYAAYCVLRQGRFATSGALLFWGAVLLSFLMAVQGLHDAWREATPFIHF